MPLPVAVVAGVSAIGFVADVLGIYSFFSSQEGDNDRQRDIDQLKTDLSSLQSLPSVVINQNIAQSLGSADTALDQLALYRAEEDATQRDVLANNAVLESQSALNDVKVQVQESFQGAQMESLAYSFGALHYAIAVRMMVANAVQDGPLGAAGLHESIKEAADFLQSNINQTDIIAEMTLEIGNSITAEYDRSFFGGSVDVVVTSGLTGERESFTVERESGFRDTFPFLPFRESNEDFSERVNDAADAAYDRIYAKDYEAFNIQGFLNTAGDVNAWLAQSSLDVSDIFEQIGTSLDDVADGNSKADFLSGLGGDDILFGANGPDGLSGGSGNDILRGGDFQDMLRGGTGNDVLFGNETFDDPSDGDTARFDGLASEYTITGGTTYATVSGPDGEKDKLFNVEFLRFDDVIVTLEEGSHLDGLGSTRHFDTAERVTMLYEAALNRDGGIDLAGLNFYIEVTDRNALSDTFLAADMMTSPEFTQKFGDVDQMSNGEFVDQIYFNVLDRTPDAAGFDFYLDLLDTNTITRASALADIAISPENTLNSSQSLMSLYETSAGEWGFVSDGMDMA